MQHTYITDSEKNLYHNGPVCSLLASDFQQTEDKKVQLRTQLANFWWLKAKDDQSMKNGRSQEGAYLMAYADWCHFCQEKVGAWSQLGVQHNQDANNQRIFAINADAELGFSKMVKLQGFPSFYHIDSAGYLQQINVNSVEEIAERLGAQK